MASHSSGVTGVTSSLIDASDALLNAVPVTLDPNVAERSTSRNREAPLTKRFVINDIGWFSVGFFYWDYNFRVDFGNSSSPSTYLQY